VDIHKHTPQIFVEAIEDLRRREIASAQKKLRVSESLGYQDAVCALMLVGIMTAEKKQYKDFIPDIDDLLQRMSSPQPSARFSAYGFYLLGRCYAFLGIKTASFLRDIWKRLRRQRSHNRLLEDSIACYRRSASDEPSFIAPYFEIALIYDLGLNDCAEAIEAYKKVLELNPAHVFSCRKLAELYIDTHRLAEAQTELEELIRSTPSSSSYTLLSTVYLRQGKAEQSREALGKALQYSRSIGMESLAYNIGHAYLTSPTGVASVPDFTQIKSLNDLHD